LPPDRKRERMEIADELGDRFRGVWDGSNTGVMPKEQGALITVKIAAARNPMARNVWGQNQRTAVGGRSYQIFYPGTGETFTYFIEQTEWGWTIVRVDRLGNRTPLR